MNLSKIFSCQWGDICAQIASNALELDMAKRTMLESVGLTAHRLKWTTEKEQTVKVHYYGYTGWS